MSITRCKILKYEEKWEQIQRFCLFDDEFMTKCFEDNIECTELVLRIIMEKPDLIVESVRTQYSIKNLQGRSVRLDILASDSQKKKYNIEIQRDDKGAGVKRARYNSSLLDANILDVGENYENLPETYVIFITEHDIFGKGKPLYQADRYVLQTGELLGDGSHIIYVNGECKDETPIGRLMHDFSCTKAEDMHYKVLADRIRYFKEDKKGVGAMGRVSDEIREEGAREASREIALGMLKDGKATIEDVVKYMGLTLEEAKNLAMTINN